MNLPAGAALATPSKRKLLGFRVWVERLNGGAMVVKEYVKDADGNRTTDDNAAHLFVARNEALSMVSHMLNDASLYVRDAKIVEVYS